MAFKQVYVCSVCEKWIECNPEETLKGCPHCGNKLQYVPVDVSTYTSWDEETRKTFQQEYLKATSEEAQNPAQPAQPVPQPAPQPAAQKPDWQVQKEPEKKSGCVGSFMRYILYTVIAVCVFYAVTYAGNWLNANNDTQKQAEISLNAALENGDVMPVGEYVSLKARWIIGPYATQTEYREMNFGGSGDGLKATTRETEYYYVILEDSTFMSVATANDKEKETLNRMTDWLLNVDGYPMDGETITLQGKLDTLKDEELLGFYREYFPQIFGIPEDSPLVRTIVLDTTAGRENGQIAGTVAIVAVVAVIVLLKMRRNKKKSKPVVNNEAA